MIKIAILWDWQLWAFSSQSAQKIWHNVWIFWAVWKKSPAGQVSEYYWKIDYWNTKKSIKTILEYKPDVITSEWENIPVPILKWLEKNWLSVYPSSEILEQIQHRETEKELIIKTWEKVVEYEWNINSYSDLKEAFNKLWPGIIKTARGWYDSKWQYRINSIDDIDNLNIKFTNIDFIYEKLENFDYEISVIVARNPNWETIVYEPAYNKHENWILKTSVIPANLSEIKIMDNTILKAKNIAKNIADKIWMVWILCVEMFVLQNWEIKINELAPRPHNSWHHTIESYNISQYDALINAISNKTFWELELVRKSVLTNLLWNEIKKIPNREINKWFTTYYNWDNYYYDYWKDISEISEKESELPKGRKMWHKVEIF